MLKQLSKRLHLFLTVILMAIITLILCFAFWSTCQSQRTGEITYIQRMASLIIYQLEADAGDFQNVLSDYETDMKVYSILKNAEGETLYESPSLPREELKTLMDQAERYLQTQSMSPGSGGTPVTEQGGYMEIRGNGHDRYYGILSTVSARNGQIYTLALFFKQISVWTMLLRQLPAYGIIWSIAFVCVFLAGRFLMGKAFEPTERVLQSQRSFVAAASHELKSPLAVIMANAETARDNLDQVQEVEGCLKTIDAECLRMSRLVQDMLLLASSDAGQWTLQKRQVNVDTLLITLYEAFEPVCAGKSIALELEMGEESYPDLYTDPERLFQILSIYMDNAVSYSSPKQLIRIRTKVTAKFLTFLIEDHGRGISLKDKPFIFDRFYCADASRTDKSHFGLGLSIARELAKILGCEMGFFDTPGGGATFFLTFRSEKRNETAMPAGIRS